MKMPVKSVLCVWNKTSYLENNLKFNDLYYRNKLEYRRRNEWVSELDVCTASCIILQCIKEFSVNNGLSLLSDHGPIYFVLSPPGVDRQSW